MVSLEPVPTMMPADAMGASSGWRMGARMTESKTPAEFAPPNT